MKNFLVLSFGILFILSSCSKKEEAPSIVGQWELRIIQNDDGSNQIIDEDNRQATSIIFFYYVEHGYEFYENGKMTAFHLMDNSIPMVYETPENANIDYHIEGDILYFDTPYINRSAQITFVSNDVMKLRLRNVYPSEYEQKEYIFKKLD